MDDELRALNERLREAVRVLRSAASINATPQSSTQECIAAARDALAATDEFADLPANAKESDR